MGVAKGGDWIDRFLRHRRSRELSASTLAQDRQTLAALQRWMKGRDWDWCDLTVPRMERFVQRLREGVIPKGRGMGRRLASQTIQTRLRSLRVFFRYLVDEQVLLFNPASGIHEPVPHTLCAAGIYSRREMDSLFACLQGNRPLELRDRAMVAVFYGCGVRLAELRGLDLTDCDLEEGALWVRHGKGGKDRLLPLGKRGLGDLASYLMKGRPALVCSAGQRAVFLSQLGTRLGKTQIRERLRKAQEKAGVHPLRGAHAFRHAFATHLLEEGADVRAVQELLGHSRLGSTARYTQVDLAELRRTLRRAHPRERRNR